MLARNLLGLRQLEFVAVLVEYDDFLGPRLVNLSAEELSDLLLVFVVEIGLFQIHYAALEVLADVEYSPASEVLHLNPLGEGLSDFVVVSVSIDLLN